MADFGWPILFALFVWWFSTGAVLYLDGLSERTFKWSMLAASAVGAAALVAVAATTDDASQRGAYAAFSAGLLIWGWHEMAFLLGYLTGPRKTACHPGCSGVRHFVHGIETLLYHELAIIATAVLLAVMTAEAPNRTALWTFVVLMAMRQSAKLNVFLGVRNLNAEFLPPHLDYLKSFLKTRPMNLLFPVTVTAATVVTALLGLAAMEAAPGSYERTSATLLGGLMALAVLEHWFLVLPLPAEKLWTWGLASRKTAAAECGVGPAAASAPRPSRAEA